MTTISLVNEKEAAKYLTVSLPTIRRWRGIGKGPVYKKIGPKTIRYAMADLERFVNVHTTESRQS